MVIEDLLVNSNGDREGTQLPAETIAELFCELRDGVVRDVRILFGVFRGHLQYVRRHVRLGCEVKSRFLVSLDGPECQQALKGDEVRQYRLMFLLVEQQMGGLIVPGNANRRMSGKRRILLHDHRLTAGRFNPANEFTLQFDQVQESSLFSLR